MEAPAKVVYSMAVSSLLLTLLAAKASYDRARLGHYMQTTEPVAFAYAVMTKTCEKDAPVTYSEDEFLEAMQDSLHWCRGTVLDVFERWDSSITYEFRGTVNLGGGYTISWTRQNQLTEAEERIRQHLRSVDSLKSDGDASFQYELLSFNSPLNRRVDVWFASSTVGPTNFGENVIHNGWVAYILNPAATTLTFTPLTVDSLRESLLRIGGKYGGDKAPEAMYPEVVSTWRNQTLEVPVVDLELPYTGAVIALSLLALVQLIWIAAVLPGVNPGEIAHILRRLSLTKQMKAASTPTGTLISILDWAALSTCGALVLASPMLIAFGTLIVRTTTNTDTTASIAAPLVAFLSLVPAFRIFAESKRLLKHSEADLPSSPLSFVRIDIDSPRWMHLSTISEDRKQTYPFDNPVQHYFYLKTHLEQEDPTLDLTLLNATDHPILILSLGLHIGQTADVMYAYGGPEPRTYHLTRDDTFFLQMPFLKGYPEFGDTYPPTKEDMIVADQNCTEILRLKDPICIAGRQPYRFGLCLVDYIDNMPNNVAARITIETNQGQVDSDSLYIFTF